MTRMAAHLRVLRDPILRDVQRSRHVEHGVVRVWSGSTGGRERHRRHGSRIRRNPGRKSNRRLNKCRSNLSRKLITFALKASRTQRQF
jgi:hypothetical protein